MVFDAEKMKWVGNEAELDVFADIDLHMEDSNGRKSGSKTEWNGRISRRSRIHSDTRTCRCIPVRQIMIVGISLVVAKKKNTTGPYTVGVERRWTNQEEVICF